MALFQKNLFMHGSSEKSLGKYNILQTQADSV